MSSPDENDFKEYDYKKHGHYLDYTPQEFESAVAQLFRQRGFQVRVTPHVRDGGIDLIVVKDGRRYGVECKRHRNLIGASAIRTFIGALVNARLDGGYFVTTSDFTKGARNEVQKCPIPIRLVSGKELERIRRETRRKAKSWQFGIHIGPLLRQPITNYIYMFLFLATCTICAWIGSASGPSTGNSSGSRSSPTPVVRTTPRSVPAVGRTPTPWPSPTPTPFPGWELRVQIRGGRAWLRVIVDGEKAFEGTLPDGTEKRWEARESLILRTGNAGATYVTVNGRELGVLGKPGEVVEKVWETPQKGEE